MDSGRIVGLWSQHTSRPQICGSCCYSGGVSRQRQAHVIVAWTVRSNSAWHCRGRMANCRDCSFHFSVNCTVAAETVHYLDLLRTWLVLNMSVLHEHMSAHA